MREHGEKYFVYLKDYKYGGIYMLYVDNFNDEKIIIQLYKDKLNEFLPEGC